jgi:F1F0 ATPase subunit 2
MTGGNVAGLVYAGAVGVVLGLFYYGGLWLTVRRLPELGRPELWIFVSLVLRIAVVVAVLLLLFGEQWERLVAAMAGMLAARIVLVRRIGPMKPGGDE